MKNSELSRIFFQIAKILEIKGENSFRIRAYERAAENIKNLTEDIESLCSEGRLTDIPGVGKDLAARIKEFVDTGKLQIYEELLESVPKGVLDLLDVPSVGPRTAKLLYEKLKIRDVSALEKAIKDGRLRGIPGIKDKTAENIFKGIELLKKRKERMPLSEAIPAAEEFIRLLKKVPGVEEVSFAGSLRRRKETVRDIDILVVSGRPEKVMDSFVSFPSVKEILAKGETKSSIRTKEDIQVDCRVVEKNSYGAALLYFTGSKNFNIHIRALAQKKDFRINEYGVFPLGKSGLRRSRGKYAGKSVAGRNEEEIFKLLKISYIEPELREDTGEIELAAEFNLPRLIENSDLKGDLHVHSVWSDGENTIEDIVNACRSRGNSYVAITDHSQSLKIAGGLGLSELREKRRRIEAVNKKLKGFRVLCGAEVDIDSEGNLDYKDEVLKELDIVIAAIHNGFKQSKERLTKRLVKACRNKYVHIIAHPTGKLWGVREEYDIDFDAVMKAAAETNTYLEVNSFPLRMDLNDLHCRRAKEMGAKMVINTDAHSLAQLDAVEFGVFMARRGWLSRQDVINSLDLKELLKALKR